MCPAGLAPGEGAAAVVLASPGTIGEQSAPLARIERVFTAQSATQFLGESPDESGSNSRFCAGWPTALTNRPAICGSSSTRTAKSTGPWTGAARWFATGRRGQSRTADRSCGTRRPRSATPGRQRGPSRPVWQSVLMSVDTPRRHTLSSWPIVTARLAPVGSLCVGGLKNVTAR